MGDYVIYFRGKSFHVRDLNGNHWTLRQGKGSRVLSDGAPIVPAEEYTTRQGALWMNDERRKKGKGTYGRFSVPSTSSLPSLRGASHGAMNILLQEGSWAWYTGWFGHVKRPESKPVAHGYVPKRSHTKAMNAATVLEVGESKTATEYARLRSRFFSITSGHANIRYEWCHLVAHGMGGADAPDNIVAATTYQNSEQLILECVLFGYMMEGLTVHVEAKLALGWKHLAESIRYGVKLGDATVYSRTMDARRATRPDFAEYAVVAREMRKSLNSGLEKAYPATNLYYEQYEHILRHLGEADEHEPDQSAGFWSSLTKES